MLIIPERGVINITERDSGVSGTAIRNQFAMVKAQRPHATHNTSQMQSHHTLYASPDYLAAALQQAKGNILNINDLPDLGIWALTPLMRHLLAANQEMRMQQEEGLREQQQEHLTRLILLESIHILSSSASLIANQAAVEPNQILVKRITQYVIDHCEEGLSQQAIAEAFQLSARHLSRLFRQYAGETLHDCLQRQRMRRATELLSSTGLSILEIAGRLGFDSASHFAQVFRRYYHQTPLRWRQAQIQAQAMRPDPRILPCDN